jgi:exodeoxyribonuclease V alpha subunit
MTAVAHEAVVTAIASQAIDRTFARLVMRLVVDRSASNEDTEQVILLHDTALLLSSERAQGHSCLDLATWAGQSCVLRFSDSESSRAVIWPSVERWVHTLEQSGLCRVMQGRIDEARHVSPNAAMLVLDGRRLYLARYHEAETRLAASIRARIAQPVPVAAPGLDAEFARLFPRAQEATDWQAVAAQTALERPLVFVTGGPGTGKTTVAARMLALLLHADPTRTVAIAAPTGRAAARLVESIGAAAEREQLAPAVRAQLPGTGATLHRLLGYQPWSETFRHDASHPLPHDVVIVDEASMVDVLMMDALFRAVRPDARLIVLGDPDQLASVDTGFVLGDVVRAAKEASVNESDAPLAKAVVRLRHSWRFGAQPGIGALATGMQQGDWSAVAGALESGVHHDVLMQDWSPSALQRATDAAFAAYVASDTPQAALEALSRFRVLAATREGARGVQGLNALFEWQLRRAGRVTTGWYDHRPVLITANDPSTQLFNGDIGVTLRVNGVVGVHFLQSDGRVRSLPPSRLPAHETAWAMTIHKSQGSEFDMVVLVLPEQDSPLLTRELLYTGVTRARQRVVLLGEAGLLATGVRRSVARSSGLVDRLVDGVVDP